MATGSSDHSVRLWDAQTGAVVRVLQGHKGTVWSVAWRPGGRLLATGACDSTVRLWEVATGDLAAVITVAAMIVIYCVAWSPCGELVFAGGDGVVRIHRVTEDELQYNKVHL